MHRIRRFGERSGKDAVNQGLGVDYRVGRSDQPRLEMGSRYDVSATTDPRSEFQRWSHRAMFNAPLARRLDLELGATQTTRTYPKRLVELEPIGSLDLNDEERRLLEHYLPDNSGSIPFDDMPDDLFLRWRDLPRRDEMWAPTASIALRAANGVQARLAYEMEVRLSNDLRRGYSGHSVELWTGFSI